MKKSYSCKRSDHKHEYKKCYLVGNIENPIWYMRGEYCSICGRQRFGEMFFEYPPDDLEIVELEL